MLVCYCFHGNKKAIIRWIKSRVITNRAYILNRCRSIQMYCMYISAVKFPKTVWYFKKRSSVSELLRDTAVPHEMHKNMKRCAWTGSYLAHSRNCYSIIDLSTCADPEVGSGRPDLPPPPPPEKSPSQHSMLGHHRHAGKHLMAFRSRADDAPLTVVLGSSLPSSTKKTIALQYPRDYITMIIFPCGMFSTKFNIKHNSAVKMGLIGRNNSNKK